MNVPTYKHSIPLIIYLKCKRKRVRVRLAGTKSEIVKITVILQKL